MRKWVAAALVAAFGAVVSSSAGAEVSEVRIASTIGLAQFPARIAYEQNFIGKRAAALGIPDLKTSFQQVTSGVVVSDLLLSGHADLGVGGNVPMFALWDKTDGKVRGIASLSQGDMFLMSCDPHIKTIKDIGPDDRLSMTDLKTTTYALVLQMEAAKLFGWDNRDKLATNSVAMSDPDGMGAILSCKTEVKNHMTILPWSTIEQASGKAHVVFSSEELLGHPYTFDAAFATADFEKANPKVSQAIAQGLQDAIDYIQKNPEQVADTFMKEQPFPGTREMLVALIKQQTQDHFSFSETPESTTDFMSFMYKSGGIKKMPASWKDVWFQNVWNLPGN